MRYNFLCSIILSLILRTENYSKNIIHIKTLINSINFDKKDIMLFIVMNFFNMLIMNCCVSSHKIVSADKQESNLSEYHSCDMYNIELLKMISSIDNYQM